jgi:precorrin-2/cobalt-factor-2 C20-methyltransferase
VHKSSIYLPRELKSELTALAARTGRSEADLIRTAIERLIVAEPAPAPSGPVIVHHPRPALVGVGVGPGDPGLVTARARAVLLAADRVVVMSTDPRSVGRAEMVVRAVAATAHVQRVPFAIAADDAGRHRSLADLADAVMAPTDAGELVAVAVIGDPAQWTIFPELAAEVAAARPSLPITAEPGITSYQAAAAAAATTLGRAGAAVVVVDDAAGLAEHLAGDDDAVVLYKSSTDGATVKAIAHRHHRAAVVAELSGLPGQRLTGLDEVDDGPISYLATVVFPPAVVR